MKLVLLMEGSTNPLLTECRHVFKISVEIFEEVDIYFVHVRCYSILLTFLEKEIKKIKTVYPCYFWTSLNAIKIA